MVIGAAAREGGEELHLSGKNIESTFLSLLLESGVHTVALGESLCFVHACVRETERGGGGRQPK